MAWDVEIDGPFGLEFGRRRDLVAETKPMVDGHVRFTTKRSVADFGAVMGVTTLSRAPSVLDRTGTNVR